MEVILKGEKLYVQSFFSKLFITLKNKKQSKYPTVGGYVRNLRIISINCFEVIRKS